MGIVYTVVTETIDFVQKVKNDKKKEELQTDEVQKDNIIKPVEPPKYYTTIEARKEHVKDGPYTVEAISESLKNDVVPVGYSLEQLQKVGFGADVREYKKREEEERKENQKKLLESLEKFKKRND